MPVSKCQLPQFDQAYESSLFHTGMSLVNVNGIDCDNQNSDHHLCHHDLDFEHIFQHANYIDQHANDQYHLHI